MPRILNETGLRVVATLLAGAAGWAVSGLSTGNQLQCFIGEGLDLQGIDLIDLPVLIVHGILLSGSFLRTCFALPASLFIPKAFKALILVICGEVLPARGAGKNRPWLSRKPDEHQAARDISPMVNESTRSSTAHVSPSGLRGSISEDGSISLIFMSAWARSTTVRRIGIKRGELKSQY